jgi:hypothetical protein
LLRGDILPNAIQARSIVFSGRKATQSRAQTRFGHLQQGNKMTLTLISRNRIAVLVTAVAACLFSIAGYADEAAGNSGAGKAHPIADVKKAAKAVGHGVKKTTKVVGHGFRDGTRAVGHETRKVTKEIGHAFRDGAHEIEGKKD